MSNTTSLTPPVVNPPISQVEINGNTGTAIFPAGVGNIVGSGNLNVAAVGDTLTISDTQAQVVTNYKSISFTDSPYVVISDDFYISVDSSGGAVTVRLPNSQAVRRLFVIKDRTGNANVNPISITTPGGVVTIDGAVTYNLNQQFEAVDILYNLTSYEIY